ncbi:hypothetical protein HOP50_17g79110 [Chloropicon primus]|uniref:SH3 domain-containing protein n=3 Tax=Chloropicon primus TaxID=1764295 RepID=A0A5B8MXT9_9CHLO|nr:hypothetical protein A3770_17p78850 [Chloropicon primus]UPR04569.1 hypothetical protein HOP50_17g79110 [Chloropicon primus]|eukprot:QDZ25367.1 hypothetical protein A3770_17p78850 [Chloropicon primus]
MAEEKVKVVSAESLASMLAGMRTPTMRLGVLRRGEGKEGTKGGRVFQAIRGNERWHEEEEASTQSMPRRGEGDRLRLEYRRREEEEEEELQSVLRISYGPRVVVRDRPSLGGHVLGARRQGEEVRVVARSSQGGYLWVKLAEGFREGKRWSGEKEAWMCAQHEDLGTLLRRTSGARLEDLREEFLMLEPEAGKRGEGGGQGATDEARGHYKVIHSPSVMVRDKPSMDGRILGALGTGRVVDASEDGSWLKLHEGTWVQRRHPELGLLLEKCRKDGSSYYY